jgi:hypothetical protein
LNTNDPSIEAFCITNTYRPLLSYGPKHVKGSRRTYLYVESLRRFQAECAKLDLSEAYKKAGQNFRGRLEHTFVVLKDPAEGSGEAASGSNKEPLGKKRPAEGDDGSSKNKKPYVV